jgi:hypothetical protein
VKATIISLTVVLAATSAPGASYPAHPQTAPEISGADISARTRALSDDAFEGRGPGTVAGEAAAGWIADELKRLGIAPANKGSYFQSVPAVSIAVQSDKSQFTFSTPKGKLTPKFAEDAVYWTPQFSAPM